MDKGIAEYLWQICRTQQNAYGRLWCDTTNTQKAEEARQTCGAWAEAANLIYRQWLKPEPVTTTKENHDNGEFSTQHASGDTGAASSDL